MTGGEGPPHVRVHRDDSGWRWEYVAPAEDGLSEMRLPASVAFTDADEARQAAETAYPGVPVLTVSEDLEAQSSPRPPRGRRADLVLGLCLGLGLGLGLSLMQRIVAGCARGAAGCGRAARKSMNRMSMNKSKLHTQTGRLR